MAEPEEGTEEYYRQLSPSAINQQAGGGVPPAVRSGIDAAKSMTRPGPIDWGREAGIAVNQLGLGAIAPIPFVARTGWNALHGMGIVPNAAPALLSPGGPGGYEHYLDFVPPQSGGERILAGGMKSAGSAALAGPRAMLIAGVGGAGGQALREAGWQRTGDIVDFMSGLGAGYSGIRSGGWFGGRPAPAEAPPVPGAAPTVAPTAPAPNVIPFPTSGNTALRPAPTAAPAATAPAAASAAGAGSREAEQMDQLIRLEQAALRQHTWAPIINNPLNPFNYARAVANRWLAAGAMSPAISPAVSAAQRILGLGVGSIIGGTSAGEGYGP